MQTSRTEITKGTASQKVFRSPRVMEGTFVYVIVITISVFCALIWAHFAEIDRVVRVSGRVIAAGRGQEIQHLEGGIISSINAVEGGAVKKGDVLLTIESVTAEANLEETQTKLMAQKLKAVRLEAESKDSSDLVFPDNLAGAAAAEAEKRLFLSRRMKLHQETTVHEEAINQQTAKLNEVRTRAAKLKGELEVARNRTKVIEEMAARGASSKLEMLEAKSRERRLETEINDATSSIPTLEATLAEEKARKRSLQADFVTAAQNDLVNAISEIERLENVLKNDSDRFKRTDIRAPIDGIVNRITVNTIGGVIRPGDKIIELIPYTNDVLIEARALPKDRGNLHPGLDATVRISAYDVGELGVLKGKVKEISADTIPDSHGEVYYRVTVLVSEFPPRYKGKAMVPGMTATADVITGRRTVLNLILSPIEKFTYRMFRDSI